MPRERRREMGELLTAKTAKVWCGEAAEEEADVEGRGQSVLRRKKSSPFLDCAAHP